MRLLFLSLYYPLPADNGVKMRTWALLRALAAEGHEVTLLTFANPEDLDGQYVVARKVCRRIECVPKTLRSLSANRDYAHRLRRLFTSLPYGVAHCRNIAFERRILALLDEHEFDAVFCEQTDPLINLPASLPVPLILDNQNVEHLILERYAKFERHPGKRAYALLESRKVRNWEKAACERAAVAMACSEYDRGLLEALCPGVPIVVAPNTVETDAYPSSSEDDGRTVLYQGGMDWYPNRDAVQFFVSAIWPRLRKLAPRAKFVVAGRNPSDEFLRQFARVPGIEFTGTVPDMRAEIANAAVSVVPLRIGSGTRLKILEAGAMAKPIVSTRLGGEGLEFADGQEIILADEPEAFAQSVSGLLADPLRRRMLGRAARHRVERQYSFHALRIAVRQALAEVTRKKLGRHQELGARPLQHASL